MKTLKNIQLLFAILLLLSLFSCQKEQVATPHLEGSIIGKVFTFDEFGEVISDNSGVLIKVENYGSISTVTDYYGQFELKGLATGTYTLTAGKEGFGNSIKYDVKHYGGKPTSLSGLYYGYGPFILVEKSSGQIINMEIKNDTIYSIIKFSTESFPSFIQVHIYYSQSFSDFKAICSDVHLLNHIGNGYYKGRWRSQYNLPDSQTFYVKACTFASIETFSFYEMGVDPSYAMYREPKTGQIVVPYQGEESEIFTVYANK